jgi:hypothetical protein
VRLYVGAGKTNAIFGGLGRDGWGVRRFGKGGGLPERDASDRSLRCISVTAKLFLNLANMTRLATDIPEPDTIEPLPLRTTWLESKTRVAGRTAAPQPVLPGAEISAPSAGERRRPVEGTMAGTVDNRPGAVATPSHSTQRPASAPSAPSVNPGAAQPAAAVNPVNGAAAATPRPPTSGLNSLLTGGGGGGVKGVGAGPQEEVVFLIDWDDTLCASTHAQQCAGRSGGLGDCGSPAWRQLARWVFLLLQRALQLAPNGVYIVTNSETGWVEMSVDKLMPELKPLLPRLRVISARSLYSTPSQDDATRQNRVNESDLVQWKYRAFVDVLFRHRFPSSSPGSVFNSILFDGDDSRGVNGGCDVKCSPNLLNLLCRPGRHRINTPLLGGERERPRPIVGIGAGGAVAGGWGNGGGVGAAERWLRRVWQQGRGGGAGRRGGPIVVAMGDSPVEQQALELAASSLGLRVTKWIKFTAQPSINALIDQVRYVCTILPAILLNTPSLRITLNPDVFSNTPKHNPFVTKF